MEILARAFDAIMQPCHALTGNWWLAILLFTLVTKVVLLPVSLWTQKNSVLMVSLLPQLNRIKVDHFGDKEAIGEAQSALYKKEHYHPLLSLLPLCIQVVILFGLVDVIRSIVASGQPGTELLGLVPIADGGWAWVMPVLAALSSLILGLAQNHINPLQREQSKAEQASTNGLSIALSAVLGVSVASGMVFYWICSNLLAILVQLACNAIYKPAKHVDYDALRASQADLAALENLDKKDGRPWWRPDPLAKREKDDIARFYDVVGKHIVFYSERSGFYKYFQGAIEWLLANSDIRIHYITNDPNDQVFKIHESEPRLIPYYVGEKRLITMMMKMDCDVFVATLADLDNYYLKRSYVRKDIEYVFMFHHMTSTFLVGSADCHDHYDTLLCVGPHQVTETEREEEVRDLPKKRLVPVGYDLLDRERAEVAQRARPMGGRPTVLIAPSWQEDCILDLCADETIQPLVDQGFRVIVRPHPEYTKRHAARWKALQDRFAGVPKDQLFFEQDFSSADSIFDADVLVTDWSSISCEFSFCTMRPTVFIDTPMKEGNDQWRELGLVPTDISLRDQIGRALAVEDVDQIGRVARDMMAHKEEWARTIDGVYRGFIFNPGRGGEAAGRYLLQTVLEKQGERTPVSASGPTAGASGKPASRRMKEASHEG